MSSVKLRLSFMMFLQFFVWGAWYVSMTGFINQEDMEDVTGAAYTIGPLAAIFAPFFLGMVADRFFPTERVLGVLHLLGGLFLCATPLAAKAFTLDKLPEDASLLYRIILHDLPAYSQPFILLLLGHMLCYMPTVGLTTSISLHNLENPEKEFPAIRVLGTLGWIAGNIAVSYLPGRDQSAAQFYMAGGVAILLGLFSFSLPHTPPPMKGKKTTLWQVLGLESLKLLKEPAYLVFILSSFLICIPLAGYYAQARNFVEATDALINSSATFTMSLGQMSEVFFMLVMPFFFIRLGVKNMLAIGMLAWIVRYGLFALGAEDRVFWMVLLGVLLHGICYDFYFVTGMIYVDKKAPPEIRNQAQGLFVLVTQGLGLGLGAKFFFAHVVLNTSEGVQDWHTIWVAPAAAASAVLVLFLLFFHDRIKLSGSEDKSEA